MFSCQWHLVDFRRERGNILEFIDFFRIISDHCRDIVWERASPPLPERHINGAATPGKPADSSKLRVVVRRDRVQSKLDSKKERLPASVSASLPEMSPLSVRKLSVPYAYDRTVGNEGQSAAQAQAHAHAQHTQALAQTQQTHTTPPYPFYRE